MRRKSPRFPWICGAVALCLALVYTASASPVLAKPPAASKSKKKPGKEGRGKEKENGKEKPTEAQAPAEAPAAAAPQAAESEETRAIQRGERVEFDARLIQGQTAKAGAVYLFARVSTNLRSMVKERSSFRDKIVRTVFPTTEAAPPPPPAAAEAPKEEVAP